jgi:hypothetical protein
MDKEKLELLKDLSGLLEKGLITKEEFESQKLVILKQDNIFDRVIQRISLLVRMLTPQIVVLIALFLFYSPVSKLVRNASEVAFGESFSFKIQQALNISDPELASIVSKLTKEEIAALITVTSYRSLYSTINRNESVKPEVALDERFDIYVSLQEKGLFHSDVSLKRIKEIFESKRVNYTSNSPDPLLGSLTNRYYLKESFSEEEIKLIEQASGYLTPAGQRIYWLIVDNAAEELSKSQ